MMFFFILLVHFYFAFFWLHAVLFKIKESMFFCLAVFWNIFLFLGIILGITSNGFLKSTNGFTNIGPTIFCIVSIVACIFCLSKAMNIIPVGFTYATYGGLTITAVTLFGVFKYNQIPNIYGVIGIALIIVGVILLNTFGKTT